MLTTESIITTYRTMYIAMASITLILNGLLIVLIIRESPQIFAAYKWLLLNVSVSEVILTLLLEHSLRPIPLPPDSIFLIDGMAKYYPLNMLKNDIALTFGFLTFSFMAPLICSIYRYLTLAKSSLLKRYSTLQCTAIVVLIELIGFAFNFSIVYAAIDFDQARLLARLSENQRDYMSNHTEEPKSFFAFNATSNVENSSPLRRIVVLLPVMLIGITITILLFAYLTAKTLQGKRGTMKLATYKMHKRFVIVLVIEVLYPILMVFFPLFIALADKIFGILRQTDFVAELQLTSIALVISYPIAHAFSTICLVTPYRKAVINGFYWIFDHKNRVPVIHVRAAESTVVMNSLMT